MSALITLILFGILQGFTEFLPVSSSGHLSLFQYFSKEISENLSLNIAVHIGTLLTILIYYKSDLTDVCRGFVRREREAVHMVFMIIVASIPTALIGLYMKKNRSDLLTNPLLAAICLFVTGLILFQSRRIRVRENFQMGFGINYRQALLIGVVQGLAVLPGISRSGTTIIAGLMLGMNPKNAARFSFLVSVPAILGAGLLEVLEWHGNMEWQPLIIGGVVSFLTGLFAISWMVKITMNGQLKYFSYYLFSISTLFLMCYFMGWGQGAF